MRMPLPDSDARSDLLLLSLLVPCAIQNTAERTTSTHTHTLSSLKHHAPLTLPKPYLSPLNPTHTRTSPKALEVLLLPLAGLVRLAAVEKLTQVGRHVAACVCVRCTQQHSKGRIVWDNSMT